MEELFFWSGHVLFFQAVHIRIRIRMSFIARYVYTYEEFVFMTEASTVQQNDSDRTKIQKKIEQVNRE